MHPGRRNAGQKSVQEDVFPHEKGDLTATKNKKVPDPTMADVTRRDAEP